jgi:hypothetical protein
MNYLSTYEMRMIRGFAWDADFIRPRLAKAEG